MKMDLKEMAIGDPWARPCFSSSELSKKPASCDLPFPKFDSGLQQKWEDTSVGDYAIRAESAFQEFDPPTDTPAHPHNPIKTSNAEGAQTNETWDARAMLSNLSFLEQKIHQLQDLVHLIVGGQGQALGQPDELLVQQKQLVTADLTSIIVQLISTAGSLLPSVKNSLSDATYSVGQLGGLPSTISLESSILPQINAGNFSYQSSHDLRRSIGVEHAVEEHDIKDEDDADEGEHLPPGSYEILQIEKEEILAPHTHFCLICGKGFKRDANLRMHMRGHGDEYKTPAALAKPNKESSSETMLIKRYSCPYAGCKRNKDHKKFQPLKTMLCVKNHYKRTHCDKSYTCSRCNTKKFSVIADLKTHEKHCGKDKWLCSCGTTFSRKDKLFGHMALFQGHTPAIPQDEVKGSAGTSDRGETTEATNEVENRNFDFGSMTPKDSEMQDVKLKVFPDEVKGSAGTSGYFSPASFDTCNFGGFHEFPRLPFEDSESSFSFLIAGSCNYAHRSAGESGSDDL